jgi:hypothetical protein
MERSISSRLPSALVIVCLVLNLSIWVFVLIELARHARYYPPSFRTWEGPYPQVILGWGLPLGTDPMSYIGYRIAFYANLLAWVPVNALFHHLVQGSGPPPRILGTTPFGYQLIAWIGASFFQWYAIGWMGQRLWRRYIGHAGDARNVSQRPLR